jgi:hypothetical protein
MPLPHFHRELSWLDRLYFHRSGDARGSGSHNTIIYPTTLVAILEQEW